MKHVILDEAGDVGLGKGATAHFLVAVAIVGNIDHLRRVVSRVRKRLDKRLRDIPEFKAAKTDPRIVMKILKSVASVDCEIMVLAANKSDLGPQDDPESLYRRLCALAARRCVDRHRRVVLIRDKRYSDRKQEQALVEAIGAALEGAAGMLVIEPPRESEREQAIQAVDAVAWAVYQRLENKDDRYYELIRDRIVLEEWLK